MIRVALSCGDAANRVRVRNAFGRCVREANLANVSMKAFAGIKDVLQSLAEKRAGYIDYVICFPEPASNESEALESLPLEALRQMREEYPDVSLGIISTNPADAICAYGLDAGFMLLSDTYDVFKRMVGERLSRIAREKSQFVTVRSSNGIFNVALDDIQFVESSKRGSVVHMPGGDTLLVRSTLQSLFESLCAASGQELVKGEEEPSIDASRPAMSFFVKAGSSFIVNLDNVRSAGEGSFVFADGETIIIPIRKRKALKDALSTYRDA